MTDRPPRPSAAAIRAAQALRTFGPHYKRWFDGRLPAETGITAARLQPLAVLAEHGPLSMVALSRRLGTTAHNVTKLVDWLEAEGLVQRRRDTHDRRAVTLHVTPEGLAAQRRLAQAHLEAVAEAFTDLTDPQLDQLTTLLDRLQEAIQRRLR